MKLMTRARALLVILVLGTLGVLAGCAPSAEPQLPGPRVPEGATAEVTAQDVGTWLDGQIPTALERGNIPGATVTVVHGGEILASRGYGYAETGTDGEEKRLVDPDDTLFRVGSVSKLATDVAVMQLVEQGDVDLDTDVSEYVDVPLDRRFDGDITLRHLLTHTAGFEERLGSLFVPAGEVDLEAALQEAPAQVYAPGTTPAYSNYGLALAGYVVQEVSGQPFEQYLQEHVFDPAGMDSSSFEQPLPEDLADRVATGYATTDGPGNAFETIGVFPAGSMSASGTDMGRFMLALMGQSTGKGQLLGTDTRELMQSPALDSSALGALAEGQRMTLGYFDESRNGHRILGHGGDTDSFHSALEIYPDDATGVFISMNGSGEGTASLTLRSDLMRGFSDRYFSGEVSDTVTGAGSTTGGTASENVETGTTEERADVVAGRYETTRSMHTTFLTVLALMSPTTITALDDGSLLVSNDPGTTGETVFEEISPWVWQEQDGYRRLTVQVEDGQVVRIGHDSAMSIVPTSPLRTAALPVLALSLAVLALVVIAWPIGGALGWHAHRTRTGADSTRNRGPLRWTARLARLGALAALIAAVGWVSLLLSLASYAQVEPIMVRGIQVFQLLAALSIVPALVDLVRAVRRRDGAVRIITASALVLALAGLSGAAIVVNLFSLDVTF